MQQFRGGEIVVKVRLFGQKTDLGFDDGITPVAAQNAGGATAGEDEPHEELQGRGFAGAVRPKIAKDFALRNGEAKRMKGDLRPLAPKAGQIRLVQTKYLDGSHGVGEL